MWSCFEELQFCILQTSHLHIILFHSGMLGAINFSSCLLQREHFKTRMSSNRINDNTRVFGWPHSATARLRACLYLGSKWSISDSCLLWTYKQQQTKASWLLNVYSLFQKLLGNMTRMTQLWSWWSKACLGQRAICVGACVVAIMVKSRRWVDLEVIAEIIRSCLSGLSGYWWFMDTATVFSWNVPCWIWLGWCEFMDLACLPTGSKKLLLLSAKLTALASVLAKQLWSVCTGAT